jgi:GTPase SAR1 family protein
MDQFSIIREGERLEPYDYSIMLIGGSGNGKSTLINAFLNAIVGNKPGSLQVAIACEKYPMILSHLDDGTNERNDAADGKSQTTHAHFYKFCSDFTNGKTILIVDTPGIASTGGVKEDDDNIEIILNAARRTSSFNAVVVVEKSSTNRMNPLIEYCLYRLAEVIPTDFESKIVLALTFYTGVVLFQDKWFPFNIQHKLKLNNVAFSFSTAEYEEKPKCLLTANQDWDKSIKQFRKFFTKLFSMPKVPTIQYTNLFNHHNELMNRIAGFRSYLDNIEKCKLFLSTGKPGEKLAISSWIETPYHNTICAEHGKLCHEHCYLSYNDTHGTSFFNNCACMGPEKRCRVCGCASEQHAHRNEKPAVNFWSIDEMLDTYSIGDRSSTEKILSALENMENKYIMDLSQVEANLNSIVQSIKCRNI